MKANIYSYFLLVCKQTDASKLMLTLSAAKGNTLSKFKPFGHTLPFIFPDISKTLSFSS